MLPPKLQSTPHDIVNHYVKIWHVRLGVANNMHPLSWGGGGTNGKNPNSLTNTTIASVNISQPFITFGVDLWKRQRNFDSILHHKMYHKFFSAFPSYYQIIAFLENNVLTAPIRNLGSLFSKRGTNSKFLQQNNRYLT